MQIAADRQPATVVNGVPVGATHFHDCYGNLTYWKKVLKESGAPHYDYKIYRWYYYEHGEWVCSDAGTCSRNFVAL